jgi:hypothetical protein
VLPPITSEEKKFMQRTTLHLLAMLSIAGAGSACGGDDEKPEASTGLPTEAKLSELESSDAPALCDAIKAGVDQVLPDAEVKRLNCTFAAVISMNLTEASTGVDVGACESYVDKCIAGEKTSENGVSVDVGTWSSQTTCDQAAVTADIGECEATVADYEACLNAALQDFASFRDAIRCSALGDREKAQAVFSSMPDPTSSAACKPLEEKCAGLFDELSGK